MAQPMIDPRILELDASHRYPSFQSPRPDGTSEARARWVRAINTVIKQRVEPSPRSKLRSAVEQITLGIRQRRERENDSDDDQGSSKRRKLNLWKCKNCRDARKKVSQLKWGILLRWDNQLGRDILPGQDNSSPLEHSEASEIYARS